MQEGSDEAGSEKARPPATASAPCQTSSRRRRPRIRFKTVALGLLAFIALDKSGFLAAAGLTCFRAAPIVSTKGVHSDVEVVRLDDGVLENSTEAIPAGAARSLGGGEAVPAGAARSPGGGEAVPDGAARSLGGGEAEGAHAEASHPHEAMIFLCFCLVLGSMVAHLGMKFHGMQATVAMFVLGMFASFLMLGAGLEEKLGLIGRSHKMWMEIDPHLLLFTLLPPLLAGDAMTIDTNVAMKVGKQCLYLAGPGVLINAMLAACFLYVYLPYDWSFQLCLTTGAILCATDPVAVVALLKELGASPSLTVQIQGESLLNDGTAIVLYTIAYNLVAGVDYSGVDILVFLIKTAVYAWVVGMMTGMSVFFWIRSVRDRLDHNSSLIQVSLTLVCAYASFCIAEGFMHISGVLSTVAASGVLAHYMWHEVVSAEVMHTIWHMFEYLGNTIIFFLAGALTGNAMVHNATLIDYVHLIVIYLVLLVIRFALILGSRPLLRHLHAEKVEVTLAEALVMGWGGLRGAVGMALAIQVSMDRAKDNIEVEQANRVLFYVCGVAFLTLFVNAPTCPWLVKALGITQMPVAKKRLMLLLHARMVDLVEKSGYPPVVLQALNGCLMEMKQQLNHQLAVEMRRSAMLNSKLALYSATGSRPSSLPCPPDQPEDEPEESVEVDGSPLMPPGTPRSAAAITQTRGSLFSLGSMPTRLTAPASPKKNGAGGRLTTRVRQTLLGTRLSVTLGRVGLALQVQLRKLGMVNDLAELDACTRAILLQLQEIEDRFEALPTWEKRRFLRVVPSSPLTAMKDSLLTLLSREAPDVMMARAINSSFLGLLRSDYNRQVEHGDISSTDVEPLLMSVTHASNIPCHELRDFDKLKATIGWHDNYLVEDVFTSSAPAEGKGLVHSIAESPAFRVLIMVSIMVNCVQVYWDSTQDFQTSTASIALEVIFTIIFSVEFLLRFAQLGLDYFKSAWYVFDFFLVVVGIVGLVLEAAIDSGTDDAAADAARTARIFKMLRAVRQFRLIKIIQELQEQLEARRGSAVVAEYMKRFTIILGFIRAHINAQTSLLEFCGKRHRADSVEVALCLISSQVSVYKAMVLYILMERRVDAQILDESHLCLNNVAVIEKLTRYIDHAREQGLLNTKESEMLIEPMHTCYRRLQDRIYMARVGQVSDMLAESRGGAADRTLQQNQCPSEDSSLKPTTYGAGSTEGSSPSLTNEKLPVTAEKLSVTRGKKASDQGCQEPQEEQPAEEPQLIAKTDSAAAEGKTAKLSVCMEQSESMRHTNSDPTAATSSMTKPFQSAPPPRRVSFSPAEAVGRSPSSQKEPASSSMQARTTPSRKKAKEGTE